jgi:tetratricopeptide (TPR) repeat protein
MHMPDRTGGRIRHASPRDTELAAAYLRQNKPTQALGAAEAGLAVRHDPSILRLRTAALLRLGRTSAALEAAQATVSGSPELASAAADLALALLSVGKRADAAAEADRALSLDRNDATALAAGTLAALAESRWTDAERIARAALENGRGSLVGLRNNLALALVAQGRIDEARGILRSVQEVSLRTEHARVVHRNLQHLGGLRTRAWPGFFTSGGAYTPAQVLVFIFFILLFNLAHAIWILIPVAAPILIALVIRGMLRGVHDDRQTFQAAPAYSRVTVRARTSESQ